MVNSTPRLSFRRDARAKTPAPACGVAGSALRNKTVAAGWNLRFTAYLSPA